MTDVTYLRILLIVFTMLLLPSVFAAQNLVCGSDPVKNTRALQEAINRALPVDTLVLPPGVCVVAKCEVADPNAPCKGASGKHSSALYIGNRLNSNLDVVGDPSGTSVLKLDPNPPRLTAMHPYCSDTHLVSVEAISHVTFRGFAIDGSHNNLSDDSRECPKTSSTGQIEYQGFAEHMHGLYIKNATDVEIVDMKITNAHGDGLNLIANINLQPLTQGITVRDSKFLGNKRSGIGFQRNVSDVTITGNLFRNSGTDQDLDMESTGKGNAGPSNITIANNRFERAKAGGIQASGIAVTLGAGSSEAGHGISFTGNAIVPAPGAKTPYGGCIFVYKAEQVAIKDNKVIGTNDCFPVEARKVQGLTIEGNELHGYRNPPNAERFSPSGVVRIAADTGKIDEECTSACEYKIHYADGVTILNNCIYQHVQSSSGIDLEGADGVSISGNKIVTATNPITPVGTVPDDSRAAGVTVLLGVHPLGVDSNFYVGERKLFNSTWVDANAIVDFKNAVLIQRYPDVTISSVALTGNSLSSNAVGSRGLYLKGASPFVTNTLTVDHNRFGCGFVQTPPELGSNAFVRPLNQAYKGDIGSAIPGNPTPCVKP